MKAARRVLWIVSCCLLLHPASAQDLLVQASVDRSTIRENESFTYTVRAQGRVRGEPDISPLERQFDLLNRSSNTRIQILNGETQQIAEWLYQLIPTMPGTYTLPPVSVDGVLSNPIELEVLPAVAATDDEPADIFIEVEAAPENPYVQSQVVYTLKLFVGVSTGRATLTAPTIEGGEAILERLGEDTQYQVERGGRSFIVRERRYAIFPQETGPLTIGPATFEAMVIPNRGFSRVQRMRSDSIALDVRPPVPPPAEYPNASWLPAVDLRLEERWADQAQEFSLGVPRTRTLTIEADGLLETQLPEIALEQIQGVRQYPDQPELDHEVSEAGLTSRRVERYAVIAQASGETTISGLALPWFDTRAERWEVARIDARTVNVLPGDEPFVDDPPAAVEAPVEQPAPAPPRANHWRTLSAVLGLGWLATLLLWLRSARAGRARPAARPHAAPARRPTDRRLKRQLRDACARNDAEAAQQLLLEWAALRFESPPQSLGALAERLPSPASSEVAQLEAHLYGRHRESWDGRGLAAALAGIDSVARQRSASEDPLLPLYR